VQKNKLSQGFTLIEIIVVIAIIAVLAVLSAGAANLVTDAATETIHRANARDLATALDNDFLSFKQYCTSNGQLQTDQKRTDCYWKDPSDTSTAIYGTAAYYLYKKTTGKEYSNQGACWNENGDWYRSGGSVGIVERNRYYLRVVNGDCTDFLPPNNDIYKGSFTPTEINSISFRSVDGE
jgi:prepilin-type N-terminal cleavage/methylation domain-containing protein